LHRSVKGLPEWEIPDALKQFAQNQPQLKLSRIFRAVLVAFVPITTFILVMIASLMFLPPLLGQISPELSPETRINVVMAILLVTTAIILVIGVPVGRQIIARARGKQKRGEVGKPLWRDIGENLLLLLLFVVFWAIITGLENISKQTNASGGINLTVPAIILLFGVVCMAVLWGVLRFPFYYVLGALKQGQYDTALRRIRRLKPVMGRNSPTALFIEGTILGYAGRFDEAETILRESLAAGQKNPMLAASQSVALENLGWTLFGQGRADEAIQAFEGAIQIRPEGTDSYNGLAWVYLHQNRAQRALELTSRAMDNKRKRMRVDRYVWGEIWANRAWALAQLGRYDEAQDALDRAFRDAERGFKPSLSRLHYCAAQVEQLMGKTDEAVEHLETAQRIDPDGASGKRAGEAIRQMGR
jgi:Tfp pilus assembly protein PilF